MPRAPIHRYPAVFLSRFLLGDWTPLIRDPIDVLRLSYVVAAVVFAVQGDIGAAGRMAATAAFVWIARWANLPRPFDLAFVIGMGLQGWGNVFNAFEDLSWWDNVVHVSLSASIAPLFYILLARAGILPGLHTEIELGRLPGVFLVAVCLGTAFGAGYEIYEWLVDHVIGGHLAIGETDTVTDLACDIGGSAIGAALLVVWASRGWSTERRVPPRRLIEIEPASEHQDPDDDGGSSAEAKQRVGRPEPQLQGRGRG